MFELRRPVPCCVSCISTRPTGDKQDIRLKCGMHLVYRSSKAINRFFFLLPKKKKYFFAIVDLSAMTSSMSTPSVSSTPMATTAFFPRKNRRDRVAARKASCACHPGRLSGKNRWFLFLGLGIWLDFYSPDIYL